MSHVKPGVRRGMLTLLAYTLWLASAALAIWVVLIMRLFLLIDLPLAMSGINPWTLSTIDKFGTVLLGAIALVFMIVTEAYFHRLPEGRLSTLGVVRVFAIEGLLLGIAYVGRLLL